jgi:uncharacterized protein YqeY
MLKQKLRDELKESMMARDGIKTSVLRMLISAITYYEINKGGAGYEATDEDVLSVIQTQVKQRRDSIEQFENAGRQELADKEKQELALLTQYLPQQLSEDEIKNLVKDAIKETGSTAPQDMGKVMAFLMPKVKGKSDGSIVSRFVKEALQK